MNWGLITFKLSNKCYVLNYKDIDIFRKVQVVSRIFDVEWLNTKF